MYVSDTIAAIATAPGMGGVSIVRISGPEAEKVLMRVFKPLKRGLTALESHMLTYGHVMSQGQALDECMAVLMRAPRSYTREDVAELQLHGGSFTAQAVLNLCLENGARLAEAGEFTRRAFLNGRIDLSQAEAVMSLIAARGAQSHAAAMRQLRGGASQVIRQAADKLYQLQAGAAACIDYPEEISEEEAVADLLPRLEALAAELDAACNERAARLLSEGMSVVLAGRPNAGKSSLLNALLGEERAIVTNIPGTTRDTVQGEIILNGTLVRLTDTAGIHEAQDPVEQLGVMRAQSAVQDADCVLWVLDASRTLDESDREALRHLQGRQVIVLLNKSDLPAAASPDEVRAILPSALILRLCAARPETLAPLREALQSLASIDDRIALTQPRHLEAARRAARHLRAAAQAMDTLSVDLSAIDMQSAQNALAEITGDQVEEKLLDAVFSTFCVGK